MQYQFFRRIKIGFRITLRYAMTAVGHEQIKAFVAECTVDYLTGK